ncbi:MAG: glycosyltransferase [Clostridium sp.]|uniref:glycosyltransferase n=1 Tax=Clostridium sp. TaxID=1506 RepID=UPI003F3BF5C6
MKISVICPVYNGEKYLDELHGGLLNQKLNNEFSVDIFYALTESNDETEKKLIKLEANYKKFKKEEFSHSYTREVMAYEFGQDIIVFISQDIIFKDDLWLYNLVKPIKDNECEASFSRQISKYNNIEKYTREYNYGVESRVVNKNDIDKLGLYTFFYSDASSAVLGQAYKELNGYDKKRLIINEDMYFANKLIESGYKIKYCSDSIIYHSHKFKLKELFKRYFDTGVFFMENKQFRQYSGNKTGMKMVEYIFKRCLEEKNISCLASILPDFGMRFLGSNLGKHYDKLSKKLIYKFTLNKSYWKQ